MHQLVFRSLFIVFTATSVLATSDTKLTTKWRDTNAKAADFTKVVVAFVNSDPDLRRRVEDGLVRRTRRAVAAYSVVPYPQMEREALKAHLKASGIDAAIVVTLISVEKDMVISSGDSWQVMVPSFYAGWDSWGTVMTVRTASYSHEDKIVTADIVLYSVATGEPVWIGRFKDSNPKSLRVVLDDLVKAGTDELRKQKLL